MPTRSAPAVYVLVLVLAGVGSACRSSADDHVAAVSRDCARPVVSAALGRAWRSSDKAPAEFTTDGSPVYVTMSDVDYSSLFGKPPDGDPQADVSIGHSDKPFTYSLENGLKGAEQTVRVEEDQPGVLHLAPGRYWIVVSRSAALTVDGCTPGAVTDAKIVPPYVPQTGATGRPPTT